MEDKIRNWLYARLQAVLGQAKTEGFEMHLLREIGFEQLAQLFERFGYNCGETIPTLATLPKQTPRV